MQKIFIEFKYMINEKEYRVLCEPNSPFADCKEAALQFIKEIGVMEDNQKAAIEAQKKQEPQQQLQQEVVDG